MNYEPILAQAARIANDDPRKPHYLDGEYFRPGAPTALTIVFDPWVGSAHVAREGGRESRSDAEIEELVNQICTDAIAKALSEFDNGRYIVSLMIADASTTRNNSPL